MPHKCIIEDVARVNGDSPVWLASESFTLLLTTVNTISTFTYDMQHYHHRYLTRVFQSKVRPGLPKRHHHAVERHARAPPHRDRGRASDN